MKMVAKVRSKKRSWWSKAWESEQTRDLLTSVFALIGLMAVVVTAFDRLGWLLGAEGLIAVVPVALALELILYLFIRAITAWANTHGWG